ncbi:MAG TPA: SprT family zinc-dependent metalloprotease [Stellaceae bacterium]|nr:SprT family zinc-dependent metalloprotease [Stellaceae bacterium]
MSRLPRIARVAAVSLDEAQRRAGALGLGAPVAIRVNARARRLLLRIDATERKVELVLPRGVPAEQGLRFLEAQRGWIAARLEALPQAVPFAEGAIVPVFGMPHRICRETNSKAPPVAIVDAEIRVRGEAEHVARRVRDHLARLAARELASRARVYAAQIERPIARVTVRDTKSRWGSCSAKGCLSFSWRLVMAPETVVDYVVAHEVAHLAEMNHGPRFWRLVQTLTPDCTTPRAWLKRHRSELFSYG